MILKLQNTNRGLFSLLNHLLLVSTKYVNTNSEIYYLLKNTSYTTSKGVNDLNSIFTQTSPGSRKVINCRPFPSLVTDIDKMNTSYEKFIKPKIAPDINTEIIKFREKYFNGCHLRGTDRVSADVSKNFTLTKSLFDVSNNLTPQICIYKLKKIIDNILDVHQLDQIFLATDCEYYMTSLCSIYGKNIIHYSSIISPDVNRNLHHNDNIPKDIHMKEAIIDSILLSAGDYMLRTKSNMTIFSKIVNPRINYQSIEYVGRGT